MRVLAEKVSLLVLGPTLALLVGTRFDGFFIAGLLLAVSIAGLVEWLRNGLGYCARRFSPSL